MQIEQLLALVGFTIAMVGTPGPNNLMLIASGANFGFRRTIPHILGISLGCQILIVAIALGLGQLFSVYPQAVLALKILGCAFLLYLAFLLVRPQPKIQQKAVTHPMRCWQAALFQWVNPKAWMMFITAVATYTNQDHYWFSVFVIAMVFLFGGAPLIAGWAYGGSALKYWLQQGSRLQNFNRVMAGTLLLSLYPVLA